MSRVDPRLRRKASPESDLATAVCERGHSVASAWEAGPRVSQVGGGSPSLPGRLNMSLKSSA